MSAGFKDYFSTESASYLRHRPDYPDELFAHVAALAPAQRVAWDCGCGSGQASRGLARHFTRVIATDASAAQVAQAPPVANVAYRVATAERPGIPRGSVDLVAVAQALHWFDLPAFFATAHGVLTDGGVVAAWCYGLCTVTPALDAVVHELYEDLVGSYWPPERRMVDDGYAGVATPAGFVAVAPFASAMQRRWTLDEFAGYLATWSGVRRFREATGRDAVAELLPRLRAEWGAGEREVTWPVTVRGWRRS